MLLTDNWLKTAGYVYLWIQPSPHPSSTGPQGFIQDRIQAISQDQVKTVLLLESLKSTLWALDFLPPRPQTPTLIYQHEEALYINNAHLSFSFYIYSLGSGMKESYTAQNSLQLKLPSRTSPPFYAKQTILSSKGKNGH